MLKCSTSSRQGCFRRKWPLIARNDCVQAGTEVYTSGKVIRIEGRNGKVCKVVTDKREIDAQLVIFRGRFYSQRQTGQRRFGLEMAPLAQSWPMSTCALPTPISTLA